MARKGEQNRKAWRIAEDTFILTFKTDEHMTLADAKHAVEQITNTYLHICRRLGWTSKVWMVVSKSNPRHFINSHKYELDEDIHGHGVITGYPGQDGFKLLKSLWDDRHGFLIPKGAVRDYKRFGLYLHSQSEKSIFRSVGNASLGIRGKRLKYWAGRRLSKEEALEEYIASYPKQTLYLASIGVSSDRLGRPDAPDAAIGAISEAVDTAFLSYVPIDNYCIDLEPLVINQYIDYPAGISVQANITPAVVPGHDDIYQTDIPTDNPSIKGTAPSEHCDHSDPDSAEVSCDPLFDPDTWTEQYDWPLEPDDPNYPDLQPTYFDLPVTGQHKKILSGLSGEFFPDYDWPPEPAKYDPNRNRTSRSGYSFVLKLLKKNMQRYQQRKIQACGEGPYKSLFLITGQWPRSKKRRCFC